MKRYKRGLFYDITSSKFLHVNLYKDHWGRPCINFEGEWWAVEPSLDYGAWVLKK